MPKPRDVNCIVPASMLESMLQDKKKKLRESALETLLVSERMRERRSLVGGMRMLVSGGSATINRSIFDADNGVSLPGDLARSEGQAATGNDAVNEAYDGLGITHAFYKGEFGRNSLDGNGMRLDATVHFGFNFQNAFWNGSQMVFGDGDGTVFIRFTKSLDVIAHELTHGVIDFGPGLEYEFQSGALNESFADVFGSLVKQFNENQTADEADWLIGNDILGPTIDGVALRSLKEPGSAYDDPRLGGKDPQPAHMDDYVDLPNTRAGDFGGVHINSGIPNQAFFLVATELGENAWEDAGHIWYDSLFELKKDSDFEHCAKVTIDVAGRLFGTGSNQQTTVREAWDSVGVATQPQAAPPARARRAAGSSADGRDELKKYLQQTASNLQKAIEAIA